MQAAAKSNLKSVNLELGGKSPLIVFADADLQAAADLATTSITYSMCDFKLPLWAYTDDVAQTLAKSVQLHLEHISRKKQQMLSRSCWWPDLRR